MRIRRFSAVAEVVVESPDRYLEAQEQSKQDAVLVFTHDHKFVARRAGRVGGLLAEASGTIRGRNARPREAAAR